MSAYFGGGLVVSAASTAGGGIVNTDNPVIGYKNFVPTSSLTSLTAASGYPVSNLKEISTALRWRGVVASPAVDEYVTSELLNPETMDYVGIAKHNFFTNQIAVSIEALQLGSSPQIWEELTTPIIPLSDGPILFRFTSRTVSQFRIRMQAGSDYPEIGIVYGGALTVLQRRIYVGHVPITYGTEQQVANHYSISGNFLGRVILSERSATRITQENITPEWYRQTLEPFRIAAQTSPFFFAWRPASYPLEVGFVWTTNSPKPENQLANGMMSFSFDCEGVT